MPSEAARPITHASASSDGKGRKKCALTPNCAPVTPHEVERGLAHGLASSRRRRDLDANARGAQIDLGRRGGGAGAARSRGARGSAPPGRRRRRGSGARPPPRAAPPAAIDSASTAIDDATARGERGDTADSVAESRRPPTQPLQSAPCPAPRSDSLALLAALLLSACSSPAPAPGAIGHARGPGAPPRPSTW